MKDIKIGIGVITYQRNECLDLFEDQLEKFPPYFKSQKIVIAGNNNVARAKNQALFMLRECDYIFIFEDDCFPVEKWWDLPFIRSGYGHSMYMNSSYVPVSTDGMVTKYKDCSGVFLFMDNPTFKKVGYFNEEYLLNGLEHIGHSDRLRRAENQDGYVCLNNTGRFIYSLDLQGPGPYKVYHKSTMSARDKKDGHTANWPILEKELKNEQLYYGSSLIDKLV